MSHDDMFNSRYGPRTAQGGIKAQTGKGAFGKSWWAKRWLSVLESLDLGGRLARGRVYARRGQVLSVDIEEGVIKAKVQGSRLQPYEVLIKVKTIPMEQWISLSASVFSQAILAAKLLSGEMPQDIESLFSAQGLSLFPKSMDDFATSCSCPDFSNPCKHIASVYYLLGEEFDRDPFLIFRMRGLGKEKLLDLITQAGPSKTKSKRTREPKKVLTATKVENTAPPLPLEDFWKVQSSKHLQISISSPATNASLPKRLGNFSFWRSSYPLSGTLDQIYKGASEAAIQNLAQSLGSRSSEED